MPVIPAPTTSTSTSVASLTPALYRPVGISCPAVRYEMDVPDRVPKERYYDADFYAMEAELLWPRVWQMACRLEEIPGPGDFVEYEILDQSIVVARSEDATVH